MNSTDVISVNPGHATLGSLHPEVTARILRGHIDMSRRVGRSLVSKVLGLVFGVHRAVEDRRSLALLAIRLMFGVMLLIPLDPEAVMAASSAPEVMAAVIGCCFCLGFMTRLSAIAGVCLYGWMSAAALSSGVIDQSLLLSASGCLAIALTGPGRFGIDLFLRRFIFHLLSPARRHRNAAANRMSYKAYHYNSL